jgi:predicted nucleic acid-binding protein
LIGALGWQRRTFPAASSESRPILLLQTLAEFANVAIRKAGIPIEDIRRTIDAWRAVLPIQAADDGDFAAALEAVRAH